MCFNFLDYFEAFSRRDEEIACEVGMIRRGPKDLPSTRVLLLSDDGC